MRPCYVAGLFASLVACGSELQAASHDGGPRDAAAIQNPTPIRDARVPVSDAGGVAADKLDLLFIVDNSSSMKEEQAALRRQFPRMIRKLVSGDHDADGKLDHQALSDLHIGVVSSDLGADPSVRGCEELGDDGLLQHAPNPASDSSLRCQTEYPKFLGYTRGVPSLDALSMDFACIAALGTAGCGFEQHLESALKALWPASQPELSFFGPANLPTYGHGDRENAGFLRTTDGASAATLAIVAIADEDDCSTADRAIFQANDDVDGGNPYTAEPLNLRCYYNHDKAFPLDRYAFGFQHLGSRRVMFAGIVGVPVDLVDGNARSKIDFASQAARDAYYDKLLADPRMQETLEPPSVSGGVAMEVAATCRSALGRAYPARRFVELAKRFGQDSLIQSICGDNFDAPVDQVVERVTVRLE